MKVYRVTAVGKPKDRRFNEYAFLAASNSVLKSIDPAGSEFCGIPYGGQWGTPTFYFDKPLLPKPSFFGIACGWLVFACDEKARELAGGPMEMAGEFLPIKVEGVKNEFWIYNVTNCINVVDQSNTKWNDGGGGFKTLTKPAFLPDRFDEETVFKIAEDRGASVYCLERTGDPDEGEFKALVESHGLVGLDFELMWTNDQ